MLAQFWHTPDLEREAAPFQTQYFDHGIEYLFGSHGHDDIDVPAGSCLVAKAKFECESTLDYETVNDSVPLSDMKDLDKCVDGDPAALPANADLGACSFCLDGAC